MLDHASFRYVESWQNMTRGDSAFVREFWRKENTNVRGQVADQRVCQIVIRVLTHNGELVAVSTAEPQIIPRLMQPMYYYRCFIGAAWRQHKLMRPLIRHSFDTLERWAGGQDFPCIGLLLELENPAFRHALQLAHWRVPNSTGYTFIGRSPRGFDLRVCYFRGARLKRPDEVEEMMRPATSSCFAAKANHIPRRHG